MRRSPAHNDATVAKPEQPRRSLAPPPTRNTAPSPAFARYYLEKAADEILAEHAANH